MRLLFRILAGFISAYVFVLFSSMFWRVSGFWMITLGVWLVSWITLEVITSWRKKNSLPRLLTHLRYAPVATFIFFLAVVIAYDQVMTLRSKRIIRQYVISSASPEKTASLELHSSYRGWCGNGYTAAIYDDYADTAAEGFESSDPAVRARSLRASLEVYDGLNGVHDGPFPQLIERARNDPDPLVRKIAAEFHADRFVVNENAARTFDCRKSDNYKFVVAANPGRKKRSDPMIPEDVNILAGPDVVAKIELPTGSEVKNFLLDSIEQDDAGFVMKVNWGGGVYHYEVEFNFRCKANKFYLYRVKKVSLSTTNPDSGNFLDKSKTKVTKPNLPIEKFVMIRYL